MYGSHLEPPLTGTEAPAELFERNRRRAFTRANHFFGAPPLLSEGGGGGGGGDGDPYAESYGGGGREFSSSVGQGVGSESAAVAFRFEHLGMLYVVFL